MKRRKSFKHLTVNDRDRIHSLYMHGTSQKDIAEVLGVDPGTILRGPGTAPGLFMPR
jgi:IS30 family transposase